MTFDLIVLALGLLALYFGAEWLVRGAARLARSFGMSAIVVGLTVVAFGTSAPELAVSTFAAWRDQADVAVGNVIGSNIFNIAVILGIAAMIQPIRVEANLIRGELPIMVVAALLLVLLVPDGWLGREEAGILLVAFGGYLWFVLKTARQAPGAVEAEFEDFGTALALETASRRKVPDLLLVLAGIGSLVLGARLFVEAALQLARGFGISEFVIAVTIVALGTSLPELATSVVAALRREADIALGNIIGSNIFNALAIPGAAALLRPLRVEPALLSFEFPVMIGLSALLLPLAWSRLRLERWEGLLLVAAYLAFLALLLMRAG